MLHFDVEDTIAAIASAPGHGLRGVIRLSGEACLSCLQAAFQIEFKPGPIAGSGFAPFQPHCAEEPPPNAAKENWRQVAQSKTVVRIPARLVLSESNNSSVEGFRYPDEQSRSTLYLDGDLIIWPTRRSYTRQPAAEFHTHANASLLKLGLKQICQHGVRLALPGEFTLRAFLSGRLDLPQAEAILSVIDSRSANQLDAALKQLAGGLSGPLTKARQQLIAILAELEAGLDFVEEDIEFISREELIDRLTEIETTLQESMSQIKSRDLDSSLIRVALLGIPNAGKSSLFNALLGHERAIVSNLAGTTTDFLSGQLNLDGLTVEIIDTAGLESIDATLGEEGVSQIAQRHRAAIAETCHIRLLCIDGSMPRDRSELATLMQLGRTTDPSSASIVVATHADHSEPEALTSTTEAVGKTIPDWQIQLSQRGQFLQTSIHDVASIQRLKHLIRNSAVKALEVEMEVVGSTLVRTAQSLRSAARYLTAAKEGAEFRQGEEIVAAEIRGALEELGLVVGTVYTDDILDVVFSRFCIGK